MVASESGGFQLVHSKYIALSAAGRAGRNSPKSMGKYRPVVDSLRSPRVVFWQQFRQQAPDPPELERGSEADRHSRRSSGSGQDGCGCIPVPARRKDAWRDEQAPKRPHLSAQGRRAPPWVSVARPPNPRGFVGLRFDPFGVALRTNGFAPGVYFAATPGCAPTALRWTWPRRMKSLPAGSWQTGSCAETGMQRDGCSSPGSRLSWKAT